MNLKGSFLIPRMWRLLASGFMLLSAAVALWTFSADDPLVKTPFGLSIEASAILSLMLAGAVLALGTGFILGASNRLGRFSAPLLLLFFVVLFVIWPLPFQARLWREMPSVDGSPMLDQNSGERLTHEYVIFGYSPFWKDEWISRSGGPPYDRYETTDLSARVEHKGNLLWGMNRTFTINSKSYSNAYYLPREEQMVYECISSASTYFFNMYWSDRSLEYTQYADPETLKDNRECRLIEWPEVGSEL